MQYSSRLHQTQMRGALPNSFSWETQDPTEDRMAEVARQCNAEQQQNTSSCPLSIGTQRPQRNPGEPQPAAGEVVCTGWPCSHVSQAFITGTEG